jgi:hypothetical protein
VAGLFVLRRVRRPAPAYATVRRAA